MPCSVDDYAGAKLVGYVVLSDTALTNPSLNGAVPPALGYTGTTNACYALQPVSLAPGMEAGLDGAERITWSYTDPAQSTVRFSLFRARDAFFTVSTTFANGQMSHQDSRGVMVARRVGEVDVNHCIQGRYAQRERDMRLHSKHTVSALPTFMEHGSFATAWPSDRFILYFNARILAVPRGTEQLDGEFIAGLTGATVQLAIADSLWTVGPSARAPNAAAYADEALLRIAELRVRGVPPSNILLLGVGSGNEVVLEVLRRTTEPVPAAFVGECGAGAAVQVRAAHDVMDVQLTSAAEAQRCAGRILNARTTNTLQLAPFAVLPQGNFGVTEMGPLQGFLREYDWLDQVVGWFRAR